MNLFDHEKEKEIYFKDFGDVFLKTLMMNLFDHEKEKEIYF